MKKKTQYKNNLADVVQAEELDLIIAALHEYARYLEDFGKNASVLVNKTWVLKSKLERLREDNK